MDTSSNTITDVLEVWHPPFFSSMGDLTVTRIREFWKNFKRNLDKSFKYHLSVVGNSHLSYDSLLFWTSLTSLLTNLLIRLIVFVCLFLPHRHYISVNKRTHVLIVSYFYPGFYKTRSQNNNPIHRKFFFFFWSVTLKIQDHMNKFIGKECKSIKYMCKLGLDFIKWFI